MTLVSSTFVVKSTTEAEYVAASKAACDLIWIANLVPDAHLIGDSASPLYVDNKGAVDIIKAKSVSRRSRHIEIGYHIICGLVENGESTAQQVPSDDNKSDGLMKPLPAPPSKEFGRNIGMA